mmetsp:Transcript_27147/g.32087  ORF Transcript_27147/g.32087 Transcript_27147/m.32087 type:complete len:337 (+) Transcript_27147:45-1055(+)
MRIPPNIKLGWTAVIIYLITPISMAFQVASRIATIRSTSIYLQNIPHVTSSFIIKQQKYPYHNRSRILLRQQQSQSLSQQQQSKDDELLISSIQEIYAKQGRSIASRPFTWDELVDIVLHAKDLSLFSRSLEEQVRYTRYVAALKMRWKSVNDHILHSKFKFEKRLVVVSTQEESLGNGPAGDGDDDGNGDVHQSVGRNDNELSVYDESYDREGENKIPPTGYIWEAHPSLAEVRSPLKVLLPNDFPYYVEDGIEHWCLWKLKGQVTQEDIQMAKEDLIEMMSVGEDNSSAVRCTDNANSPEKVDAFVDMLHWVNPPHLKSVPDIDHAHFLCLRRR